MTEENLNLAWTYYLVGVAGMMLVWWRITRPIQSGILRRQCLLVVLVLLLCPYGIGDGYTEMAPALLMLVMESAFEGGEAFFRVGPTLLGVMLTAMLLLGLVEWGLYLRRKKRAVIERVQQVHEELAGGSRARKSG